MTQDIYIGRPQDTQLVGLSSGKLELSPLEYGKAVLKFIKATLEVKPGGFAWGAPERVRKCPRFLELVKQSIPSDFRTAEITLHSSALGVAQTYSLTFFVAYRRAHTFNITPPTLSEYIPAVFDAIWELRGRPTKPMHPLADVYSADSFYDLSAENWHDIEYIPPLETLESAGKYWLYRLCKQRQKDFVNKRSSHAYSMHCPRRLWWCKPADTLHSSASRFLHPKLHRPLTIRELASIAGADTPTGPAPVAQIAGAIPSAMITWITKQLEASLNGSWGSADWESTYNAKEGKWAGEVFTSSAAPAHKVFDLSQYRPRAIGLQRFPEDVFEPFALSQVADSGDLLDPWNPWKETHGIPSI